MKQFLTFITNLKSFWKFYRNYEYDGKTVEFIIENYQDILQNRTEKMSKPTYYSDAVIKQLDEWYEEMYKRLYKEKMAVIKSTDNKFANRIDISIEYKDLVDTEILIDMICEKARKAVSEHE